MQIGIGTDIVRVERFRNKTADKIFLKKIFTEEEIKYCLNKARPEEHFAGKFAAKEAIIKAFSEFSKKIFFTDIKIISRKEKNPKAIVKDFREYNIKISISHTTEFAMGFALVQK